MSTRRLFSYCLIAAGIALLAMAGAYYWRGARAQREGREVFDRQRRRPRESPGILPGVTPQSRPAYPIGDPLARLRIPSARIDAVVFAGSDDDVLEKGPGHVPGTELPDGQSGWNNCVITAHRDTHFRNLGWLRRGHRIEVETPLGVQTYSVVSREIVAPTEVRVLERTPARRLTLITCYPFNYVGPAPKRLVIVAEPHVDGSPRSATMRDPTPSS